MGWLVQPSEELLCQRMKNAASLGGDLGLIYPPAQKVKKKVKKESSLVAELVNPILKEHKLPLIKEEKSKIKKVVGIYGGRYQPFGPHHLKTYKWLKKQVDVAYITTSDIKKPPKHPMNYSEKVRHMTKMGVPKNRIIKEKVPLVANLKDGNWEKGLQNIPKTWQKLANT